MNQKLLSINVPTYNRAKYLQALVDSLQVDLKEIINIVEINIVDNCSTDDTEAVVARLAASLPCIKYHKNPENIGPIANIHKAHRLGSGRYVWVMGDDDYLVRNALSRIVRTLQSEPAAVLLSYSRVTPEGKKINDVSIGDADFSFSRNTDRHLVPRVDPLVGFISANIVDRAFIDEVSSERFEELDRIGELAHSTVMYKAMASHRESCYLSGQPLVQTADNGYLMHDYWVHVCVRYCQELPASIIAQGYDRTTVQRHFDERLFRECLRRVLSEKYRTKKSDLVMRTTEIRSALGSKWWLLWAVNSIPALAIRGVYNLFRPTRT